MRECKFEIKNPDISNIQSERTVTLDRNTIFQIWEYYEDYVLEERIRDKLLYAYGVADIPTQAQQLIDDIIDSYNQNRKHGCDEEFSFDEAIADHSDAIEALIEDIDNQS